MFLALQTGTGADYLVDIGFIPARIFQPPDACLIEHCMCCREDGLVVAALQAGASHQQPGAHVCALPHAPEARAPPHHRQPAAGALGAASTG